MTTAPKTPPRRWPPTTPARTWRWAGIVALVAILTAAGVLRGLQGAPTAPFAYKLRVLGSSELSDMTPILRQAARATGVTVEFTSIGSVLGSQDVLNEEAQREGYDAVWFASDSYLDVFGGLRKVVSSTPIMESPVILGVRSSVARALGWNRNRWPARRKQAGSPSA